MSDRSNKRGFTLIELLVVITIIAILAAMIVPMVKKALEKGKTAAARSAVLGIETAWKTYQTEYGKWPTQGNQLIDQPAGEQGMRPQIRGGEGIEVTDEVVALLTGEPDDQYRGYRKEDHNPKAIQFLEINRDFLIKEDDNHRYGDFTDPWGNTYRFALDLDYDNRVRIGQWIGQNEEAIAKSVIAWSMGPDGKSANKADRVDDIISW